MNREAYLRDVESAYFGELSAAIALRAIAAHAGWTAPQAALIAAMADLEDAVAARLRPLIDRHGLSPVLDGPSRAKAIARAGTIRTWPQLLASLAPDVLAVYLVTFRALRDAAPEEDRAALTLLLAHEEQLVEVGTSARAGETEAGRRAIVAWLEAMPGATPSRPSG